MAWTWIYIFSRYVVDDHADQVTTEQPRVITYIHVPTEDIHIHIHMHIHIHIPLHIHMYVSYIYIYTLYIYS